MVNICMPLSSPHQTIITVQAVKKWVLEIRVLSFTTGLAFKENQTTPNETLKYPKNGYSVPSFLPSIPVPSPTCSAKYLFGTVFPKISMSIYSYSLLTVQIFENVSKSIVYIKSFLNLILCGGNSADHPYEIRIKCFSHLEYVAAYTKVFRPLSVWVPLYVLKDQWPLNGSGSYTVCSINLISFQLNSSSDGQLRTSAEN